MDNLKIQQLKNKDDAPWELLLLADPSKKMVLKYFDQGEIYIVLKDNKIIGEYVLLKISDDVVELKNIAVDEKFQRQGIGKRLIMDAINKAKAAKVKRIEVGTGNSSLQQIAFYKKCGFKVVGIDKGFFTRNYEQKIVDNGLVSTDMIRLSMDL